MFYCPKQSQAAWIQGEREETLPLTGRSVRERTEKYVEVPTCLTANYIQIMTTDLLNKAS